MSIISISNFNNYVNGKWIKNTQLPDDKDDYGTFTMLRDQNIKKEKKILEDFSNDKNNSNYSFGRLYKKLISINKETDIVNINRITDYLNIINNIYVIQDIGKIVGYFMNLNINPFFSVFVGEDSKDTDKLKLTLYVPTLSLPERKYYLDDNKDLIMKYKKNIVECFDIFNIYDGKNKTQYADDIFMIEKMIAIIRKPIEEMRLHDKLYHKTSIAGFIDIMTSSCDKIFKLPDKKDIMVKNNIEQLWTNFFNTANLDHANDLIVYDISFFRKITTLLQMVPIDKIKIYIQYIIMRNMMSNITDIGDNVLFKFFGKDLSGKKNILSRVERSITILDNYIGDVIGKEYVSRYFDEESKDIVMDMVNKIKNEMRLSIITSQWMTDKTKKKALQKLGTFKTKIGYPEKWKSYDVLASNIKLGMDRNLPLIDIINIMRYYNYESDVIKDIDGIKNPYKWSMNPQDVNAYYSPPRNEIVFPAGILQKPFFSKDYKPSKNYGAIGVVIGHEITHGYDDQGRKYDHMGNIVNWWTIEDEKNFNNIANKMIEQYNEYKINGMNVNGKLTLGENLADLGGINLSIRALCKAYSNISIKDKENFFKSFAMCWRRIMTPEKQKQQILSDPHSPAKCRIYMIRNIDEFYDTYSSINKNDNLYLYEDERIKLW